MDDPITTSRLQLTPLHMGQLEMVIQDVNSLERSLNLIIKRDFITAPVHRAVRMKLEKMQESDASQHDWLTYWLIVVKDENAGVGMLGFKGFPDEEGSTEIGYGIDPAYQGKGYMSEAVQSLIDWAFQHPFCRCITATEVENPASRRLLEKLGAQLVHESDHATSWIIHKPGPT